MNRIHETLTQVLSKNRLVFWYDGAKDCEAEFQSFNAENLQKLRVENSEFAVKRRILEDKSQNSRFLLYFPTPRPSDADNWLLDLLLQGHEYKADRASIALQECGLPYEFKDLVEQHLAFFQSTKRIDALRARIIADDTAASIRLKMISVLAGTVPDIDIILMGFLQKARTNEEQIDPVQDALGQSELLEFFWRQVAGPFAYVSTNPTLLDFSVHLFRAANPLEPATAINEHSRFFLNRWKDSQEHSESFKRWSERFERDFNISARLDSLSDITPIQDADEFELFEKKILHFISQGFEQGEKAEPLLATIERRRRSSFWYRKHDHAYRALENAIELRRLIQGAELRIETIDDGIAKYAQSWWRIDAAYRRFCYHERASGQQPLLEKVGDWVEKTYLNNFILPLNDRWSDKVSLQSRWAADKTPAQNTFYRRFIKPYIDKQQKIFVVISDALRYEAACEFAARVRSEDRWTCEEQPMLSSLPSYTQLGMAALLPGDTRSVAADSTVMVDGMSATGTANRDAILKRALAGRGAAVLAEQFLEMNAKTEGRALMRDHDVVYIYHNEIDAVGDKPMTEAQTTQAVERTFATLLQIIKRIANINATNIIVTTDHGFLFQQNKVADDDMMDLPSGEWIFRNRRFALGKKIPPSPGIKVFTPAELGVEGDWTAVFPLSLNRFPQQGSGKRFVHGGLSLQEVVVPVLELHKARESDVRAVGVELMRVPARVTTGQISIALYQTEPADDKTRPRNLRIGLYAKDGTALSDSPAFEFASKQTEPRLRETQVLLTLSRKADTYNNQEVELRLDEQVPGTSQFVRYQTREIRIQKHFEGDFHDS